MSLLLSPPSSGGHQMSRRGRLEAKWHHRTYTDRSRLTRFQAGNDDGHYTNELMRQLHDKRLPNGLFSIKNCLACGLPGVLPAHTGFLGSSGPPNAHGGCRLRWSDHAPSSVMYESGAQRQERERPGADVRTSLLSDTLRVRQLVWASELSSVKVTFCLQQVL